MEAAGDKISISVDSLDREGKTLLAFFVQTGLKIQPFALRRATLEDIFLEEVGENGIEEGNIFWELFILKMNLNLVTATSLF